jgi:hypothetical protein
MFHSRLEFTRLTLVGVLSLVGFDSWADGQVVYSLQRIPDGTVVVDAKADRWNQLILLAQPVLNSGDIDQLSSALQQAVSRFSYTVMATVAKSPPLTAADPPPHGSAADVSKQTDQRSDHYQLREVGLGYSAPVQDRQVIVTASTEAANADLGFIDRQVLSQNESDLENARVVVRSSTLMMFDMAAILKRAGGHREELVRNLVWIDPQTGRSAMAMWVVKQVSGAEIEDSWTVAADPIQVYPGGTRDRNRLHVDASTFLLGIPTSKTFALEHLLRGRQIEWNESLRQLAGKSSYSSDTLIKLTTELNQAMGATP